jgi:AcrR family transcriptional regulator
MPRYVDHEARRLAMAETAAELVGVHGLDALSFRNVARAAGSSTTVLTHYFTDKHDLMLCTYEVVAARHGVRFDEARRAGGGLYECIAALLPLDEARGVEWRMLTCYWGLAISNPRLAKAQARHVHSAQRRFEGLIREFRPTTKGAEVELIARRLGTVVHGLGTHHAVDPMHWTAAKLRKVLANEISTIGAAPAA